MIHSSLSRREVRLVIAEFFELTVSFARCPHHLEKFEQLGQDVGQFGSIVFFTWNFFLCSYFAEFGAQVAVGRGCGAVIPARSLPQNCTSSINAEEGNHYSSTH